MKERKEIYFGRGDAEFYVGGKIGFEPVVLPVGVVKAYDPVLEGAAVFYGDDGKLYRLNDDKTVTYLTNRCEAPPVLFSVVWQGTQRLAAFDKDECTIIIPTGFYGAPTYASAAACYFMNSLFVGINYKLRYSEPMTMNLDGDYIDIPHEFGKIKAMKRFENKVIIVCECGAWLLTSDGRSFSVSRFPTEFLSDSIAVCSAGLIFCNDSGIFVFGGGLKKVYAFPKGVVPNGAGACHGGIYITGCSVNGKKGLFFYDLSADTHYVLDKEATVWGGRLFVIDGAPYLIAADKGGRFVVNSDFGNSAIKKISALTVDGAGACTVKVNGGRTVTSKCGKAVYPRTSGRKFTVEADTDNGDIYGIKIFYYETGGGL